MKGYFETKTNVIELTRIYNGEPTNNIFINPDKITWFERRNGYTYIQFQDSKDGVWVLESPEDIVKAYFKD